MIDPVYTNRRGPMSCGAVLTSLILASTAIGQTTSPPRSAPPPTAFQPASRSIEGGRIDWDRDGILAEGIGKARGPCVRHRLMARRAAELVAARNALAVAEGIQIGHAGRVDNVPDGLVRVRGTVRGHKVIDTRWQPETKPPRYRVTLHVPGPLP